MGIQELIKEYKSDLNIPETGKIIPGYDYPFCKALLDLPDLDYSTAEMKSTSDLLLSEEFTLRARYNILERITRREAIALVPVQRRSMIWQAMDKVPTEEGLGYLTEKGANIAQSYRNLITIYHIYESTIFPSIEVIEGERDQAIIKEGMDSEKSQFLIEVSENHRSAAAIGNMIVERLMARIENFVRSQNTTYGTN